MATYRRTQGVLLCSDRSHFTPPLSHSLSFLSYTYLEKYNNHTPYPNVITDIRVYSGKGSGGTGAEEYPWRSIEKNKRIENGAKGGQSATGSLVSRVLPLFCAAVVICIISYSECIYAPREQKRLNSYYSRRSFRATEVRRGAEER